MGKRKKKPAGYDLRKVFGKPPKEVEKTIQKIRGWFDSALPKNIYRSS